MRSGFIFPLGLTLLLTGCAPGPSASPSPGTGHSIRGNVHGGRQPISGAHVYLFAANTTGYGQLSVSLLNGASTGLSDSVGAYVLTGTDGSFTITGDYTCTPNTQVYLYAQGGNPGAGFNSAAGLMAALGNCPVAGNFLAAIPFISVNEVTTIATAYAIAGYATDATHVSSSGTPLAQTGIANAFANVTNLVDISSGAALALTPAGNGTAPQAAVNTLANILASCINSTGSISGPTNPTTCYTLFNNALSSGTSGTAPTDTATAAINIAHYPGTNVDNLYALSPATSPFAPVLANQPYSFVLGLTFTGGGMSGTAAIAVDGSGNVWVADHGDSEVTELSPLGAAVSPSTGFTGGGLSAPTGIAIDLSGNAWITNATNSSLTELSNTGVPISPSTGFTGGGLYFPTAIAIDASGNVWTTFGTVNEFSSAGIPISPSTGYTANGLNAGFGIAMDASGNAWVTDVGNKVYELTNSGAVVATAPNGFTNRNLNSPAGVAIDNTGNVWVANYGNNHGPGESVTEFSSSGTTIAPDIDTGASNAPFGIAIDGAGTAWTADTGYVYSGGQFVQTAFTGITGISNSGAATPGFLLTYPTVCTGAIAIDGSGNAWLTNNTNGVTEYVGVAAPVVTPIVAGVKNNTLGTRP